MSFQQNSRCLSLGLEKGLYAKILAGYIFCIRLTEEYLLIKGRAYQFPSQNFSKADQQF